ncbi:carboxylate--amine ligase [Paenibacillus sambharensis]|uniref:Carboxylate--amine ligase n=1 Tax=Paenibacillus sambharensis TaxID=1803190 RepID=A0A2W1LPE1_9BACL|nr:ATP-grasp domain-containing protein [Paenibacillus sambharensis]PZD96792.1 carboxylate--amine ligase [Paenibacillus sambharensis]
MSILILNRGASYPYDQWLKELQEELLILTTPKRAKECTRYSVVKTFDNYEMNGAVELEAIALYREHHFHTLLATSEFDILRAAKIRDYLGISGQTYESALAFRNKMVMKRLLREAGVEVPACLVVETATDIRRFVDTHGFPIVCKPVDGSGSVDTCIIRSDEDLVNYIRNGIAPNTEVESFIEGDMYHVDGLVIKGQLIFSWPSKYMNGCLAYQEGNYNGSYLLAPDDPMTPRLKDFTAQVIEALPTPLHTSFHAEIFVTPDDRLVFCEIASRTGGGLIQQAVKQGFGVDLTRLSIQAQCGMKIDMAEAAPHSDTMVPSGFVLIPPGKGIVRYIPEECTLDGITLYKVSARPGQTFNGTESSVDTVVSMLIKGETVQEVQARIVRAAEWFKAHVSMEAIEMMGV